MEDPRAIRITTVTSWGMMATVYNPTFDGPGLLENIQEGIINGSTRLEHTSTDDSGRNTYTFRRNSEWGRVTYNIPEEHMVGIDPQQMTIPAASFVGYYSTVNNAIPASSGTLSVAGEPQVIPSTIGYRGTSMPLYSMSEIGNNTITIDNTDQYRWRIPVPGRFPYIVQDVSAEPEKTIMDVLKEEFKWE